MLNLYENIKISHALALFEFSLRYKKYRLGPFWLTITMLFYTGAVSLVYSQLFGLENADFIAYVTVGLVVWFYINSTIIDCSLAIISNEGLIKNYRIGIWHYTTVACIKNLLVLFFYLPVALVSLFFTGFPSFLDLVFCLLGLALVVINLLWSGFLLSMLVAKIKDFEHLTASIMQITFLLTPILWDKQFIVDYHLIVDLNIFFHLVEVVRSPLLGNGIPAISLFFLLSSAGIGWALTLFLFYRLKNRIVFWI